MLNHSALDEALQALSRLLAERGRTYELVVVGGSGLLLLGLTIRPTRDLDVIAVVEQGRYVKVKELPGPLGEAVHDVGQVLGLGPGWIDTGPADLLDLGLPEGFPGRTETRSYGALVLRVAGRSDQVFLKLYAAADHGPSSKHFQDLLRLSPANDELLDAARWAVTHDPSEGFRSQLRGCLIALEVDEDEIHL